MSVDRREKLIQLGYAIFLAFVIFGLPYLLYTYAYDRAVFDTLKKIECLK